MKLRNSIGTKAPFIVLVVLIFAASIAFAYAEDERIAQESQSRYALAQAEFERELRKSALRADAVRQAIADARAIDIEIYGGEDLDRLIASSHALRAPDRSPTSALPLVTRRVSITGQPLVIRYGARDALFADGHPFWPVLIMVAGFVLSALVGLAFYSLWRSQRAAELASIEQRLVLARSQDRLRALFDHAGDAICGLNAAGRIVFANPAARMLLATDGVELDGQPFASFLAEGGQDDAAFTLDGRTRSQVEAVLVTRDGRRLVVDLTMTPMRDHAGEQSGMVVIFHDVTERIAAEQELRSANAELEEFAYRTSHDLRSPLVSAIALLDIVMRDLAEGSTDKANRSIAMVIASLRSLERLVADILDLTQARSVPEKRESIDLAALVDDTLSRLAQLDGYSKIAIDCDFAAGREIMSQPSRVALIATNLLSNAVKYHDPECARPYIRVCTKVHGNAIAFSVEDNGLGIPEDQRENLFAMFKRFHPRHSFGSGLGLYMVKKSADIIGAQVLYEPAGSGSRFTVAFPANLALLKAA